MMQLLLPLALLALPAPETSIYYYIDDAIRTRPHTRAEAEAMLGVRLKEKERGAFILYEGKARRTTDHIITTIVFREPATNAADAGALLVLDFAGRCIPQAEVFDRYPDLDERYTSNHPTPDSAVLWSHTNNWGRYSFGFAPQKPFCLRSFFILLDKPRG